MENKKTINDLNSKVWYRFVKVIYLFLFLAIIIIANWLIIEIGINRLDRDKTLIYCNAGEKRILTPKQANISFSNNDFKNGFDYKKYYEGYNEYDIKNILEACYDKVPEYNNDEDIYLMQRVYEITGFKANPKKYDDDYFKEQFKIMTEGYKSKDQKISYLDYSIHLFDIKPVYTKNEFLKYFVIINLSILLSFGIFRRIFYYIILGTIKPKKTFN